MDGAVEQSLSLWEVQRHMKVTGALNVLARLYLQHIQSFSLCYHLHQTLRMTVDGEEEDAAFKTETIELVSLASSPEDIKQMPLSSVRLCCMWITIWKALIYNTN